MYTREDCAVIRIRNWQCAAERAAVKGNNMQRCTTGCRLLLVTPALLLLLQVAAVLHNHHPDPGYDAEDSCQSFPSAFYPDHIKQDALICLASDAVRLRISYVWARKPDTLQVPITALFTAPPQSRAPPQSQCFHNNKACVSKDVSTFSFT